MSINANSKKNYFAKKFILSFVFFVVAIPLLFVVKNSLLVHALAEHFFVVLSMGIFIIAWNVGSSTDDSYVSFLGTSFLFYGCFRLFHTLTSEGVAFFSGISILELSICFELLSNIILGIALILAPFMLTKNWAQEKILFFFFIIIGCLFLTITSPVIFPGWHILEALILYRDKIEILTFGFVILSTLQHYLKKDEFQNKFFNLIMLALNCISIAWAIRILFSFSEPSVHLFWVFFSTASYYLFYRAIILVGLMEPQTRLFNDLQESQELAQKEKEKAQRYLDTAGVIFVALDKQGRVTLVNKKGCDVLGYFDTDIIGKDWFATFIPEQQRQKSKDIYTKIVSGQLDKYLKIENAILTKQGLKKIVAWNYVLINDENGQICGALGSGEDITEKRKIEQAIKLAKHDWEMTFDAVADLIAIIGKDHLVQRVNKAMADYIGLSKEQVVGKKCYELFHKSGEPIPNCPHCLSIKDGNCHAVELFEKRVNSHFIVATSPLYNQDGETTAVVHVAHDVSKLKETAAELRKIQVDLESRVNKRTKDLSSANLQLHREINERQQIENALKKSERQFKKLSHEFNILLDAIPDILMLISPDKKILWANKSAAASLGTNLSEMIGKYCYDYMSCDCKTTNRNNIDKCPAEAALANILFEEMQKTFPDGQVINFRSFPITDDDDKVINIILLGIDITEKLTLENEALRTRHLSSLGELAAGVAHEINNPINGIINYAQIIANSSAKEKQNYDIAKRIIKEGDRIAVIISSLLSFARDPQDEEKMPLLVAEVINDVLALVEYQLDKDNIKLKLFTPDDLDKIYANQHQMEQVFLNLINNSRFALNEKYIGSHPDKILEITAHNVQKNNQAMVSIIIKDHGTGISKETIKNVLDPFFTTKPKKSGTGLGLSISHGIVSEHKGNLSIDSVDGEYTSMIVDLPTCVS